MNGWRGGYEKDARYCASFLMSAGTVAAFCAIGRYLIIKSIETVSGVFFDRWDEYNVDFGLVFGSVQSRHTVSGIFFVWNAKSCYSSSGNIKAVIFTH